ncbi:XdhC family aldehyde oxidoreductase maturation factor [Desulfovibrio sp. JC022]|uniref:XdhC family aldehyde oxidoreductase maturation factor n=1 Tax=Desulfovibrio sp. JC022 TaxID=2593642 RepID=UPI0013D4D4D5|nr:XdhC/CoxI family protein [Desulfovibrio sp. JC022]NDV24351.1 XdhC family protein [Desulfovibrio sp. JC022]
MKKLISNLCSKLESGNDLILASIIKSSGSTPRSSGSKMIVMRDGSIDGTIGGGLVEALVQKAAAKIFDDPANTVAFREFDLSNELAANADMICGGHVEVMLEHLPADEPTIAVFNAVNEALRKGKHAVLFTVSEGSMVRERQTVRPCCQLPALQFAEEKEATRLLEAALKSGTPVIEEIDGARLTTEAFIPQPDLYIFGAGHVSRPTAELATSVNFRTVVLDDRAEFASEERFPQAAELHVLPDFDDCFSALDVNDNSYIIIVTRGHLHDKTVLGQALATPARYVGMIGSSKKRNAIYDALRDEGVAQEEIDRCHCPIGLTIGAQTPEEIAVSIVGELIQKRAGG